MKKRIILIYEALLGNKNKFYYLTKFEQFDRKGPGLKASWNWPAFFVVGVWALYRKMYGWFFILWGVVAVSNALEKAGAPELGAAVIIIPWIAFATFANSLYQNNLKKKIAVAKITIEDENKLIEYLRNKGGVHTWVIWVFGGISVVGILAAILIPMLVRQIA